MDYMFYAVIWFILSALSGALYLFGKPHLYFLVAGSVAALLAALNLYSWLKKKGLA